MITIDYSKVSIDDIKAIDTWLIQMAGSNNKAEMAKFAETIIVGQFRTSIVFANPGDEIAFRLKFGL